VEPQVYIRDPKRKITREEMNWLRQQRNE